MGNHQSAAAGETAGTDTTQEGGKRCVLVSGLSADVISTAKYEAWRATQRDISSYEWILQRGCGEDMRPDTSLRSAGADLRNQPVGSTVRTCRLCNPSKRLSYQVPASPNRPKSAAPHRKQRLTKSGSNGLLRQSRRRDTNATREYAAVRIQALHRGIAARGVLREGVGTGALFGTESQECDATFGSSRALELLTESDDVPACNMSIASYEAETLNETEKLPLLEACVPGPTAVKAATHRPERDSDYMNENLEDLKSRISEIDNKHLEAVRMEREMCATTPVPVSDTNEIDNKHLEAVQMEREMCATTPVPVLDTDEIDNKHLEAVQMEREMYARATTPVPLLDTDVGLHTMPSAHLSRPAAGA